MKARLRRKEFRATLTREAMRREIIERFGVKRVGAAYIRLCANCKIRDCFLCPLTTEGKDCPYYAPRGGK